MKIRAAFPVFFNGPGDPGGPSPLPPPTPTPTPIVTPPARPSRLECEGCGCSLDEEGRIISRGDGLRLFIEREDEVKRLKKELAESSERETQLRAEVTRLTPAGRKSIWM